MNERELLMIPGPINFDPVVLRALGARTPSHVSTAFLSIFGEVLEDLRNILFGGAAQPVVVAGSGTLAMEMAVANLVERGDNVLVVNTGFFGDRFSELLVRFGVNVNQLTFEWGEVADVSKIGESLQRKDYKAVTVTHVDTSTGCANNVEAIGTLVKGFDTALIVDGVCATGAMPEKIDEWGIDVLATASQKALGVPPGLAITVFNEKALGIFEKKEKKTAYYASLDKWLPIMENYEKGVPSYFATPPVNLIMALHQSLKLILNEGIENVFRRHEAISNAFRSAMRTLGLNLVIGNDEWAASSMTAVHYPPAVEDSAFRKKMSDEGVIVAGGLGKLSKKIFRVGHMGRVNINDIVATIGAIERTLASLNLRFELGSGVASALDILKASPR